MEKRFEDSSQQFLYESLVQAQTLEDVQTAVECGEVLLFRPQLEDVLNSIDQPLRAKELVDKFLSIRSLIDKCVDGSIEDTEEGYAQRLLDVQEVIRLYHSSEVRLKHHQVQLVQGMRLYCLGKLNQLKGNG